jgi:hypothetical protein
MKDEILSLIGEAKSEVEILKKALCEACKELNKTPEDFINKARGK